MLSFAVLYSSSEIFAAWREPIWTPPVSTMGPPVNKGLVTQFKSGLLSLGGNPLTFSYLDLTTDYDAYFGIDPGGGGRVGIGPFFAGGSRPLERLDVDGNVNIRGDGLMSNLSVNNNANVGGLIQTESLSVVNNANVGNTLTAGGLQVNGNANVTGNTQTETLDVGGGFTAAGMVTAAGLQINGNGTTTGTLGVGNTLTAGGLQINGNGNVAGALGVLGLVTAPSLQINGSANVTQTTTTRDLSVTVNANVGQTVTTRELVVNNNAGISETATIRRMILTQGAQSGYFLKSDASGNATWNRVVWGDISPATLPCVTTSTGNQGVIVKWTSGNCLDNSIISEAGNTISINGSLGVSNSITAAGLQINGNANVTGSTQTGTLGVTGNANVGGSLTASSLQINGDANVTGRITTLNLTVNNTATFNGLLTAQSLLVSQDATVFGLTRTGTLFVQNNANVVGVLTAGGLQVNGNGNIIGALSVSGLVTAPRLQVNGNGNITGALGVTGLVTAPGLQVNGNGNITGTLGVGNTLTAGGFQVNGNGNITGALSVGSTVTAPRLQINGNGNITGNLIASDLVTAPSLQVNGNGTIIGPLNVIGLLTAQSLRITQGNAAAGNALLSDGNGFPFWGQYNFDNLSNLPADFSDRIDNEGVSAITAGSNVTTSQTCNSKGCNVTINAVRTGSPPSLGAGGGGSGSISCGDGVCGVGETNVNCPSDCGTVGCWTGTAPPCGSTMCGASQPNAFLPSGSWFHIRHSEGSISGYALWDAQYRCETNGSWVVETACTSQSPAGGSGVLKGDYYSDSQGITNSSTSCESISCCPSGWSIVGSQCMQNNIGSRITQPNAVSSCSASGGYLPSVADLNSLPCSSLEFGSWGLVLTTTPYASGILLYHDAGGTTGCGVPVNSCGTTMVNDSCVAVQAWTDYSSTSFGHVCLRNLQVCP